MLMGETSPKVMLEKIWEFDNDCQCKIIWFLWCWWSARNKVNSGERMKTAEEVVNDVWGDAVHLAKQPSILPNKSTWRASPEDMHKINCDGAFIPG
jgi:hypothetical protein